jgi:hypothetical protein
MAPSGLSTGIMRARMASAAPAISLAVSPRSDRSERKVVMASAWLLPSRMAPKIASASS